MNQKDIRKVIFISIIAVIIAIIVPIISEYALFVYIINTFAIYEIHDFYFNDLNGLTSTDGRILNYDKHGYAYPLDHLHFQLTVKNMFYPAKVLIQPTLRISSNSGVDTQVLHITNFDLGQKESHPIDQPFLPVDEGTNHVSLQIMVLNYTTGNLISNTTDSTSFKVQSLSDKLLEDANAVSFRNFVASLVIGGITTTALVASALIARRHSKEMKESNKKLQEQNDLLRDQATKQEELKKSELQIPVLFKIFDLLNNPEQEKMRGEIYDQYFSVYKDGKENAKETGKLIFPQGSYLKGASRRVESSFDQIGELMNQGLVNKETFLSLYAGMVARMWYVLEEDIANDRQHNSEICRGFEKLNSLAIEFFEKQKKDVPRPYKRQK